VVLRVKAEATRNSFGGVIQTSGYS